MVLVNFKRIAKISILQPQGYDSTICNKTNKTMNGSIKKVLFYFLAPNSIPLPKKPVKNHKFTLSCNHSIGF